ncbi:MAG: CaiB/BaiF CoA transferase family protein, partial [Candidatus Binatia bacterium]
MPEGALSGLKVVELGQLVSAPFCAKLMADYGAEVVKVEAPELGDTARGWGPFPGDQADREKSGLFFFLNSNKASVTADLADPGGRRIFLDLVADADLLVENQQPRQMAEWGLDYPSLAELNPQLVMVSISPFGQTGPYSQWKGYDLNAFHLTASGSRYCGHPDKAPLEHGTFAADFYGGAVAAAWGLAAVYGRSSAGGGQQVDVSCAEAIAATFVGAQNIGAYVQDGAFERRTGVGMPLGAPATILPCKDGHVWMLALEPSQWQGLAEAMGKPDWMQLDMFKDMFTRAQNADVIYPLIEEWTREHGKFEIMERCQAQGCPVTAVFTIAEAAEHEHLEQRDYFVELDHPSLGRVKSLGAPFRLPACPGGPRRAAPLLGQHNEEFIARAGARRDAKPGRKTAPAEQVDGGALPLDGLRVANFGWVWAGPVVGQTLAFLGAEVYKIESRSRIDLTRTLPPFAGGQRDPDRSLSNHACWAGNGSVTLNLKEARARQLALELVSNCDVVIENFGPGVMDKLGLGYQALRAVKPDVVMFSMPAAGLDGPLKNVRTYGLSLTSLTGLDSLNGYADGPPVPVENAFSDPFNGIMGAFAIVSALAYRDRSGEGQHVDYSQQEAVMQMIGPAFMDYVMNGRVAATIGNKHPLGVAAPHGVFPCRGEDRWISIVVTDDAEWRGLLAAMGEAQSLLDPEFTDSADRIDRIDSLHEKLAEWTSAFDDRDLAERLQRHGVAAAPVLNVADLAG